MMEDLIKAYEDRGVKFWVENGQLKFKAPSGTLNAEDKVKLRNVKEKLIEYYERKDKSALKADLSKRYEPFPLTGIQSAYLLGRNHNYEYGGVGCHAYFELSMPHMDAERLESAWHKVIMRHDMLRAVFLQNGTQKILEHVDLPKLTYFNMKEAGAETTDSKLNEIRAELAHKQYQADCWPLFDLYLTDTIDKSILHFSIDMLLSDFISMKTNTIEDINSRFDINSADRMFGLANLAFDLSVYDIFGAFNAGAALVLPDPEKQKDPYYWVETIKKNEITVWNSVPAQMQMLVSVLESRGVSGDFPLKVVLLSGDWIPVTLPDQIHTSCKKAKVVSLGGATEAAIWSIYHEIEEVPDGAVSIPYGKPLANQKFYVLNEKMEQCPDWVPGDLYIGGKGLALEYLNKPEETNAHFMYDEQLQERIYKTGDIGRYWPDGTIEFMGREDTQVKIHGHRIELSEIESALLSNTLVKTAVAVIVGKRPQDYKIVAFVEGNIEVSELTEYIKTQVPEYMVPSRFEVNEKIPLSANGKVERKALKKLAETYFQNTGKCEMPPHEGLEKEIAELWKTLLKIDRVNRTDNFYDIGGDSLLVAQAVSKTKEAINVAKDVEWDRLMIGMLQNPTIMDFAQFLNSVQIGTSHEENEISETPLNIIADIPEGGEVMKVFFPGGIGFLQQFNTLFQILVNNPERTEGIAAFNYTEDKEYLDSEEKDHIVTIGRRYADLLLNSGYRKFKLIGYCMGGLVAIEAARALLEAGAEVLPVVTIDTIPIVLEMEGDLLMERSYGLMVGADVSKAGHVKRDELVQMALELLKDHNNGFIEEDAILGLTGELPELAACYKKQKTLSKRERMENLKNAIPENSMQLSSEDMNRFDELFEIYKRNYRCAIGYTPKPFAGDLQALSCMDDHSPFVPVMKPGTEAFLSKCALGNLEVLPIGGNHLSCLMTPNVEGMANLLDGKGERV